MSICGACLSIADDYGDNSGTITCQLEAGHDGLHRETFSRNDCGEVTITWEKDERTKCSWCGELGMNHAVCEWARCMVSICGKCRKKSEVEGVPLPRGAHGFRWRDGLYCPDHIVFARKLAADSPRPFEGDGQ